MGIAKNQDKQEMRKMETIRLGERNWKENE
jgi:hypothetical protein